MNEFHCKKPVLVAVSKNVPYNSVLEAYRCGQNIFGENRVLEAKKKILCSKNDKLDIKWHMIGHLQMNKVKTAVELFDCIESVDSIKLAYKINEYVKASNKIMDIMIEINTSHEPQKSGFLEDEIIGVFGEILSLKNLNIIGLMTIAPNVGDRNLIKVSFHNLRELLQALNKKYYINMKELSMGMSNDFILAVEEGATIIRIGRAIFGERDKNG